MILCALFVFSLAYAHGLNVLTTEGLVEGSKATDGDYFVFHGIPYAGSTSGANRYKAPVPPPSRNGLFAANNSNIFCAQPTPRGLVGVEDCLTLSIFTKNTAIPKPVIVWLHADEYTNSNTQIISVRRIVEQHVVFVKLNFRLSIFGFLCLRVQEAPGNAGLKDVIQGLRWLEQNIGQFGGDRSNIILMGHGSGAAMVDLLTLSPQIEGLAHKAVVLSGSALAPWAVAYDPIGYATRLGNKLGYDDKDPKKLAKHLKETDINVLQSALNEFQFYNNTPLFAPCLEDPKVSLNNTVLREAPVNVLRSGKYAKIPVIYGYTNREGTMRADQADFGNWLSLMNSNFSFFLPVDLDMGKNKTAVAASIRDFYFSKGAISMALIEDYLDYEGDILVLLSTINSAKERALTSKTDVRLLEFAYLGTKNSRWVHNQIPLSGASHGAFLNYLFDDDLRPEDEAVSQSLVGRLSAFAYNWSNGTANVNSTVNFNSTVNVNSTVKVNSTVNVNSTINVNRTVNANSTAGWPAVNKTSTNYLYYGGNGGPTVNNTLIYVEEYRFNPHIQRTTFWSAIYSKYYVPPAAPSSSSLTLSCIFFVMICQLIVRLF